MVSEEFGIIIFFLSTALPFPNKQSRNSSSLNEKDSWHLLNLSVLDSINLVQKTLVIHTTVSTQTVQQKVCQVYTDCPGMCVHGPQIFRVSITHRTTIIIINHQSSSTSCICLTVFITSQSYKIIQFNNACRSFGTQTWVQEERDGNVLVTFQS